MRRFGGVVAVGLALMATPAFATYWDFNDWTTQGWTIQNNPNAGVQGNPAANSGVVPPWGGSPPTHGYSEPGDGTGSLYLPDHAIAWMSVPSTNSFKFSADMGSFFSLNLVGRFQLAGLAYRATYNEGTNTPNTAAAHAVSAWFEGRSQNSERMQFRDTYAVGDQLNTAMTWLKAGPTGGTDFTDYNIFETGRATIYYNWNNVPGYGDGTGKILISWAPVDYTAKTGNAASPFLYPYNLAINPVTGTYYDINEIRLGGDYSWTQSYFDNVEFVPEPATMIMLALGAVPLLRRRRA